MQLTAVAWGRSWIPWLLEPLQLLVIAQLTFLAVGIPYLDFNVSWLAVGAAALTAITTELLNAYVRARKSATPFRPFFPSSALAAALGIGIFFRASNPIYFVLAALIAILSKHIVKIHGKHVFNPSNFAIVSLVFLAPFATTIEFTQWGNNPYIYSAVVLISLAIAYRAGVLVTTTSFIVSYAALLVLWLPLSPSLFSLHHYGLIGPSFILFASFMISDPRTSPSGLYPRIVHGLAIALLYFALEASGVRYALFVASFGVAFLNAALPLLISSRLSPMRQRLPNAATGLLALILCASAYTHLASQHTGMPGFIRPSASFLFFGVEGTSIINCPQNPRFREPFKSGLEDSPSALGAAWGDFDLDGFDDIFVSGFWEPSRLYHNNRDGTFTDVSEEMGLLSEMSTSAFFADYNDDRWLDLFVFAAPDTDTRHLAQDAIPQPARKMRVYRNLGDSLRDVTAEVGLSEYESFGAASASFADYDNDGTLDVVIVDNGIRRDLYANENEALKKSLSDPYIKRSVSVVCGTDAQDLMQAQSELRTKVEQIMSVQLFQERDGCLFVTRRIDVRADASPSEQASDSPVIDALLLIPGRARLYRNTGQRFIENTDFAVMTRDIVRGDEVPLSYDSQGEGTHPYSRVSGAFFQPVSFDYDDDGRVDIFITSDFGANLLLKNLGGLRFSDVSKKSGLDYYGSGMGVALGDFNNDARADIIVSNSLTDFVFRNNGDGTFGSLSEEVHIGDTAVGWGIALMDYNLDGLEDVYVVNGDNARSSLDPDPQLQRPLLRRDALYQNLGGGRFTDRSGIEMCSDTATGFPLAVSDFDNDGDPDVFIGNTPIFGGAPESNVFLENTSSTGENHFISIRLAGTKSNSQGIGAMVSVTSGGTTQTKFATIGQSFHSQHSAALLFGLGMHEDPVDIRIKWPSGEVTERTGVHTQQVITISE